MEDFWSPGRCLLCTDENPPLLVIYPNQEVMDWWKGHGVVEGFEADRFSVSALVRPFDKPQYTTDPGFCLNMPRDPYIGDYYCAASDGDSHSAVKFGLGCGFLFSKDDSVVAEVIQQSATIFRSHFKEGRIRIENTPEPSLELLELARDSDQWLSSQLVVRAKSEPLHSLTPREFEELVAELLARDGYRVELTQATRDGGRDILAWRDHTLFPTLLQVECKRYAPSNPVGISVVHRMVGVVSATPGSTAAIVTSSRFTADALKWGEQYRSLIKLADGRLLHDWISRQCT